PVPARTDVKVDRIAGLRNDFCQLVEITLYCAKKQYLQTAGVFFTRAIRRAVVLGVRIMVCTDNFARIPHGMLQEIVQGASENQYPVEPSQPTPDRIRATIQLQQLRASQVDKATERVAHLPPPQQTHDSILKSEIAGEVFEKHHRVARLQYQPQVYGKEPRVKPRRNPAALVLLVGVPDAFDAAIGCCKCTGKVGHPSMVATGMPVVVI